MTPPHDTLAEWQFAVSCLRANHIAGGALTPRQMASAVDAAGGVELLHAGNFRRLDEVVAGIVGQAVWKQGATE